MKRRRPPSPPEQRKQLLNLRQVREAKGFTLEYVAAQLNVSVSTVSNWETGVIDVPVSRLYELALLYKVRITKLFPSTPRRASVEAHHG